MRERHANNGLRKVCKCPRRTWSKCPHSWYLNLKWQGVHYRLSLDKHVGKHLDSKTAAETEAERIRTAIRAGTFGQPAPRQEMTLEQLAKTYLERFVEVEHAATAQEYVYALGTICRTVLPRPTGGSAPLGDWRLDDIVTDTVLLFRETRRGQGTGLVGVNRNVRLLRAVFNWGIRVGYVDRTPFRRGAEPVVKMWREPTRSRRLDADLDEETKLLAVCRPHLRAVVEAALETGMRRGEILSLQWHQVEGLTLTKRARIVWAARPEIVLPWTKTKTRASRRVPISSRLKGILEMRRFDPAGQPLPADAYVFGNEIGQRVGDIGRAWETAVLKAHGHEATYTATKNLTPASRAALAVIDLHFHDLRREAGSRWLEGSVPLHTIRDWLGHTSIAQTSAYLAGTAKTAHDAMERFEAHRTELQRFATRGRRGGRKRPRTTTRRHTRPNRTAGHHGQAIM